MLSNGSAGMRMKRVYAAVPALNELRSSGRRIRTREERLERLSARKLSLIREMQRDGKSKAVERRIRATDRQIVRVREELASLKLRSAQLKMELGRVTK